MDLGTAQVRRTRRGEWISRQWQPVTRGVHRVADVREPRLADLRGWQEVLPPEGRFTHLTAAWLHGWWLPPLPVGLPELAATAPDSGRIRRPGMVAARRTLGPCTLVAGLRVDPAPDVLLACARDLGLLDLVCLVEAALARGDCTREEIAAIAVPGRPGVRRLRAALARSAALSESIWEVLLRELHVVCEIPVRQQHEVRDDHGSFLGRGDLWVVGSRDLHEFDGEVHRDAAQHAADLRRERALLRHGWRRRGYTSGDVLSRGVTILADADAAVGRAHDPSRIRAWHDLLRGSSFTAAGRVRLQHRLAAGR